MPVLKPLHSLYHPLLVLLHKHLREGSRDLDWEDYNYEREPAAVGWRQAENPLAALMAGILDFNTEELEALLCYLPTLDDSNQAARMTMAEAVEVSLMIYFGQTLTH